MAFMCDYPIGRQDRLTSPPQLPKGVPPVFPWGTAPHPSHQNAPGRYALGEDPNDVPNRVQNEYERALKAIPSIFASSPFLIAALAGIVLYLLSRR